MVIQGRQRKPRRTVAKRRRLMSRPQDRVAVLRSSLRDLNYFDNTLGVSATGGVVSYLSICLPTQGTSNTSRFGDKILLHSLSWKLVLQDSTSNQAVRIIIGWDKQPNGAAPTSPAPLVSASEYAFKDPDLRDRFIIIRDFLMWGQENTIGTTSNVAKHDPIQTGMCKLGYNMTFGGNAGTVADLRTGNLFVFFYSASNFATAGISRVLFTA